MVALDSTRPSLGRRHRGTHPVPSAAHADRPVGHDRRPLARDHVGPSSPPAARSGRRTCIGSGSRRSRACRPDGRLAVFTVQTVAPTKDGYRQALWIGRPRGGTPARRLTLGAKHDRAARFSPDGRTLAFLSDRRLLVEEEPDAGDAKTREDGQQVHLLPLDGGEARRLTDLPRGVDGFEWSPDGRRLLVASSSHGSTRAEDHRIRGKTPPPKPGEAPESDYHFVDRLGYLFNGAGFIYHAIEQLWLVDAETGEARKLTASRPGSAMRPGRRTAAGSSTATNLRRDHDLEPRAHLVVLDVDSGERTRLTGDAAILGGAAWLPDGTAVAAIGGYLPENFYRSDVWLIAGRWLGCGPQRGGRNLTGRARPDAGVGLNSDIVPGESVRLGRARATARGSRSPLRPRAAWSCSASRRPTAGSSG